MPGPPPTYVAMISPRRWVLGRAEPVANLLRSFGRVIALEGDYVSVDFSKVDEINAARLAEGLRDLGVVFSFG